MSFSVSSSDFQSAHCRQSHCSPAKANQCDKSQSIKCICASFSITSHFLSTVQFVAIEYKHNSQCYYCTLIRPRTFEISGNQCILNKSQQWDIKNGLYARCCRHHTRYNRPPLLDLDTSPPPSPIAPKHNPEGSAFTMCTYMSRVRMPSITENV